MQSDRGAIIRKAVFFGLWAVYLVLWIGGVGAHLLQGRTPSNTGWAAPVFLLIAGLIVIASTFSDYRALAIAAVAGFCAETIGVHIGIPFGRYVYTQALEPSVLGVPIVLLFAWMVLIAFVRQLQWNAIASAAVMVAIDLVIDPVASRTLAYWQWIGPGLYYGVPTINFAGWFAVSAGIFAGIPGAAPQSRSVKLAGLSIILFFTIIGFVHRLYLPGIAGLLVTVCAIFVKRSNDTSVTREAETRVMQR